MIPTIIWQGDGIRCMESTRTRQCKVCMVERKEILAQFRTNRKQIMNNNSDTYSSYKCGTKFHQFIRPNTEYTDEALAAKKSNNTERNGKPKYQDSFLVQFDKIRRRNAGALVSILVKKRPARSQKNQPYAAYGTGINTNSRDEINRHKRTIHSVPEPIGQSHQLASGTTLRLQSLEIPRSMKKTTVYQMTKFKPELLNCTNGQMSKLSFFCSMSCK